MGRGVEAVLKTTWCRSGAVVRAKLGGGCLQEESEDAEQRACIRRDGPGNACVLKKNRFSPPFEPPRIHVRLLGRILKTLNAGRERRVLGRYYKRLLSCGTERVCV